MNREYLVFDEFISKINSDNRSERIAVFIWGVLIYAIAFSIFFSPRNIVTGGTTGLSLIVKSIFHIDTEVFVFITSFVLLVLGYFLLGKGNTIRTFFGVVLLPIFMEFSSVFTSFFDVSNSSMFMVVFFGGIMMGFGNGLVIRSGFSVGGFQTLYQILYKYFGVSIGKSTLILNGILIFVSSFFFGIGNAMYAIIGLYISSFITDKVMLETSITKSFYIVTDKDKDISDYIHEVLGYSTTIMNGRGGYTNEERKVLMCAIPTRQYYMAKETIEEIDPNVFFLITDTYEVYGGM